MVMKIVNVIPELCTGCKQCELVCSFKHGGSYSPLLSLINVVKFEDRCLSVPVTCTYCERPLCEEVCPVGAITHDPVTGVAKVDEDLCIGCNECVNACPFGAIKMSPKGIAMRCDLCDGDPECVKYCPAGALKYEAPQHSVENKRRSRVVALNLD
ncbi:MAG: 4Fe-4S dicluster domain-containing protein [Firmicutes bacterium]|jgi:Fe-S-cluster-containing hydrogenase component 2|nr:4Fe-4S dicluster domain-containing protein [Bacillota bacterium]